MKLYRTNAGVLVENNGNYFRVEDSLDTLLAVDNLFLHLNSVVARATPCETPDPLAFEAPIEHQEVWAAGVTYYRSRAARIEESKDAGGGDFYDRVYSADRPELFFKAMPHKVAGPNSEVRIRSDAKWSVPEPELALLINPRGRVVGYTVGNDMSSRDIEGLNPLYLPQAKVYDRSCALGPGILIQTDRMPSSTQIRMEILRAGIVEFSGSTTLTEMKRDPPVLVEYLFRDQSFPYGCFLLTGTGIIPPDDFTLRSGDEVHISIDGIGTLMNQVA
ncbi:MAG TPA: fumarylacetoacetate hydrolase family protein [Silvibacterium sp.]|nr:fumarylacetoacetate hydrolase family protein [Silvibacterium sp.]